MERITGNQAKSLMEAYAQVYTKPAVENLNEQAKTTKEGERYTNLPGGGSRKEFQTAVKGGLRVKWVIDNEGKGSWVPDQPEFKPNLQYVGASGVKTKRIDPTKDDSGRPLPKVEPVKEPVNQPAVKQPVVKQPVVKKDPNVTAGGTKFERRLPTMAELKAAQAARAAALKAGKTKSEAEESAVKAGVLKGTTSTAASNLSGRGAITPPNGGKSATSTGSVQGSSLRQEIDAVRNQIQQRDLTSQQSNLSPVNSKGPVRIQQVPFDPNRQKIKDDVDLFDIVKGHFIEEGYSEEDTMYMMANLDENALMKYIINPIVQAGKPILKRGLQQGLRQVGRMFGRTPASTRVPSGQVGALRLYQDKANQSLQRLNQQSTRLNANDATRAATRETNRLNNLDPRTVGRNNSRREVEQIRQRNRELGRPEWAPPQPVDSLNYRPGDPTFTRSLRDYYADKRSGVKGLD